MIRGGADGETALLKRVLGRSEAARFPITSMGPFVSDITASFCTTLAIIHRVAERPTCRKSSFREYSFSAIR